MANYTNLAITGLVLYFLLRNKDKLGGILSGSSSGGGSISPARSSNSSSSGNTSSDADSTPTPSTSIVGGTPVKLVEGAAGSCGGHVYHATSVKSGGAGKNQNIHYASTGKAAISHRVDIGGLGGQSALEATVYLTMPATCSDGGKNGIGIKFYGPNHSGSSCCYCTAGIGVSGTVRFGGEGPHPQTNSDQSTAGSVGNVGGKKIGFKAVIYKTGSSIRQEAYVDLGGQWKRIGVYNRQSCGFNKTSTSPASNAEVEFRSDCANVVYHCTEVAIITPPSSANMAYTRRVIKRRTYHAVNVTSMCNSVGASY